MPEFSEKIAQDAFKVALCLNDQNLRRLMQDIGTCTDDELKLFAHCLREACHELTKER